jgi:hypothetical protein
VPQDPGRIGADLDARTNFPKSGGLFEDFYLVTGLQQQPSGGQPADPASGDEYLPSCRHGLSPPPGMSVLVICG